MRLAQCACGQLKAEADAEPYAVVVCHCRECQRRTGSPFGVGVYFKKDQVRFAGDVREYERPAPEGRRILNYFCPACGTTLSWHSDLHPDGIAIALAGFEDPSEFTPTRSVWEQSKAEWIELPDTIAGLEQGRGSRQTRG